MGKKSSYRKLKIKNQKLELEIQRLKDIIADNNQPEMLLIRKCVLMERDMDRATWFGEVSCDTRFTGFLIRTNA